MTISASICQGELIQCFDTLKNKKIFRSTKKKILSSAEVPNLLRKGHMRLFTAFDVAYKSLAYFCFNECFD